MSFNVTCPQCGHEFRRVKDKYAGKRMRCKCGLVFRASKLPAPARQKRSTSRCTLNDFDVPELDDLDQSSDEPSQSHIPLVPDFSLEGVEGIATDTDEEDED